MSDPVKTAPKPRRNPARETLNERRALLQRQIAYACEKFERDTGLVVTAIHHPRDLGPGRPPAYKATDELITVFVIAPSELTP